MTVLNSEQRAKVAAFEKAKADLEVLKAQMENIPNGSSDDFLSKLEKAEKRDVKPAKGALPPSPARARKAPNAPPSPARAPLVDAPTGAASSSRTASPRNNASPRTASPQSSTRRSSTSSVGSRPMSNRLESMSKPKPKPDSPHNKELGSFKPTLVSKRPPTAPVIDSRPVPADIANKAPGELRKEVMGLREKLAQAEKRASEAAEQAQGKDDEIATAREALDLQAQAQEERFDDMCQFMEGLLKRLKAENGSLRVQLEAAHQQTELDDFLAQEEHANGLPSIREGEDEDVDEPVVSSPLREARARRLVFTETLSRPMAL